MASARVRVKQENLKDMLKDGRVKPGVKVLGIIVYGRKVYGDLHMNGKISKHGHPDIMYGSVSTFVLCMRRQYNVARKSCCGYKELWYKAPGCTPVLLDDLRHVNCASKTSPDFVHVSMTLDTVDLGHVETVDLTQCSPEVKTLDFEATGIDTFESDNCKTDSAGASWYEDDDFINDSEFISGGDRAFIESCKCLGDIDKVMEDLKYNTSNLDLLATVTSENVSENESEFESESEITNTEYESEPPSESESEDDDGSDYEMENDPDEAIDDKDYTRYTDV